MKKVNMTTMNDSYAVYIVYIMSCNVVGNLADGTFVAVMWIAMIVLSCMHVLRLGWDIHLLAGILMWCSER